MSSVSSGPQRNWGFYTLSGELRYDGSKGLSDPDSTWSGDPGCPGANISGSSLRLEPGYWRFRISSGTLYGSSHMNLMIKVQGLEESAIPLKSVDPEVEFFRSDLAGVLTIFEVKTQAEIQVGIQPLNKKKGGLMYPLGVYLERLV